MKSRISGSGDAGISMLELTIVMGLAAVVVLVTTTLLGTFEGEKRRMTGAVALSEIRNEINISLQNTKAFEATLNHPDNAAALSCVKNKTDCAGVSAQIVIVGKSGKLIREISAPTEPTKGLTDKGVTCTSYSSAGNDKCPFQYTANWRAVCKGAGKCYDPDIEVNVALGFKPTPGSKMVAQVSPRNYSFSYRRGQAMSSNADLCASVGGTYDATADRCIAPFGGECPPGEYLLGFTAAAAEKICGFAAYYFCPEGQILQELKADGTLICGPGCEDSTGSSSGSMW